MPVSSNLAFDKLMSMIPEMSNVELRILHGLACEQLNLPVPTETRRLLESVQDRCPSCHGTGKVMREESQ
jgi:hypothetical protein